MRVSIVGGGIGGLCLANGLLKEHGFEVEVFERHADSSHELAGYGLHTGPHGTQALQRCLDPQSWNLFVAVSTPAGARWAFRDAEMRLLALRDDAKISGKPQADVERRAIHRSQFRELGGGRLRAHFPDGTSADGDILIGADGGKSKVCEQRLPHIKREDLGILIICGRYPLNESRTRDLPSCMTDGSLNNVVPYSKGRLFVASFLDAEDSDGTQRSYTLWAYVVPKSETPASPRELTASQLRNIALAGVQDWASPLNTVIRNTDLQTVTPIILRSMSHLDPWPTSNVTLLGDAIHNMTQWPESVPTQRCATLSF